MMPSRGPRPAANVVTGIVGIWQGIAALENAAEVLQAFGENEPAVDAVASRNRALIARVLARFRLPDKALGLMLAAVASVEAVSCGALLRAAFSSGDAAAVPRRLGFGLSLALFGGFFIVDEIMHDFELEASHRGIFTMLCAAYVAAERRPR